MTLLLRPHQLRRCAHRAASTRATAAPTSSRLAFASLRAPEAARAFSSDANAGSERPYNAAAAARTLKLLERRKVSTLDIGVLKRKGKPITMVTAYDYPSAVHVDLAGFDVLLVGDSLGMVELVSGDHCG